MENLCFLLCFAFFSVDSDSQEIRSEHASDVCRPLSSDDAVSDTVDGMQGNGTTASSENRFAMLLFGNLRLWSAVPAYLKSFFGGNFQVRVYSCIQTPKER